jgi:hypothetical protein
VAADLRVLGAAMLDQAPPAAPDGAAEINSRIPGIYTYWGQFIDHDMTANTDRDSAVSDITRSPLTPRPPDEVARTLRNLRRPTFDLDSLYGNGPGLSDEAYCPDPGGPDRGLYDGIRFRLGANADGPFPGVRIPPEDDLARDLPRIGPLLAEGVITLDDLPESLRTDSGRDTRAFIADLRNDENLIVAQLHLAFLRFHNRVVDALEDDPERFGLDPGASDHERFETARRIVRFHYQWLVVHDYLKTITLAGIVDKILVGGPRHYAPQPGGVLFAPLEYSVAAFRFGHSMVRSGYDHNRNFGRPVAPAAAVQPFASFADLFLFTGNGHELDPADPTKSTPNPFRGLPALPFNWIIEWDRMTDKADADDLHFARRIDTHLAEPILNMVNEGTGQALQDDSDPANRPLRRMLRSLAQRNLLRGYVLSIPTGQAVAAEMGVTPLTEEELLRGATDPVGAALANGGFLQHTPLWYYVLKEAEVRAHGGSLGELGSRIVVETQVGILRHDPGSYLNVPGGWDPSQGVTLPAGTRSSRSATCSRSRACPPDPADATGPAGVGGRMGGMTDEPETVFFDGPEAFEAWLEEHGGSSDGIWVRMAKKHARSRRSTGRRRRGGPLLRVDRRPGQAHRRRLVPPAVHARAGPGACGRRSTARRSRRWWRRGACGPPATRGRAGQGRRPLGRGLRRRGHRDGARRPGRRPGRGGPHGGLRRPRVDEPLRDPAPHPDRQAARDAGAPDRPVRGDARRGPDALSLGGPRGGTPPDALEERVAEDTVGLRGPVQRADPGIEVLGSGEPGGERRRADPLDHRGERPAREAVDEVGAAGVDVDHPR